MSEQNRKPPTQEGQPSASRSPEWDLFYQWQKSNYDAEKLLALLPTSPREQMMMLWKLRSCIDSSNSFGSIANAILGAPMYDSGHAFATPYSIVDYFLREAESSLKSGPPSTYRQRPHISLGSAPVQSTEAKSSPIVSVERIAWKQPTVELARQARQEHPYGTLSATELARQYLGRYVVRKKNGEEHSVESFAAMIRQLDSPNSTAKGHR